MINRMGSWGPLTLSFLMLLATSHGIGQRPSDFSLFEPVEASSNVASAASGRSSSLGRNVSNEPVFSLIGTSRIGSRLSVALRHVEGERIQVVVDNYRTLIPGYERYAVVEVDSRKVGIQYPQSVSCSEFPELGVSCDAENNIAMLSLPTGKAMIPKIGDQDVSDVPDERRETPSNSPRNPFEALRNAVGTGNSRGSVDPPARFNPRRIDPSDVPPGMRVVSTPFGDRLVEN